MTCNQIERLKKLVGRKGFSNNPAAEISDVMKLFEGDMAGLQKDIAALQRYCLRSQDGCILKVYKILSQNVRVPLQSIIGGPGEALLKRKRATTVQMSD